MKYAKETAVEKFGKENVMKALAYEAEPTSRVISPAYEPEHADKDEWAGQGLVEVEGGHIQALYYLSPEDEADTDALDWEERAEIEFAED